VGGDQGDEALGHAVDLAPEGLTGGEHGGERDAWQLTLGLVAGLGIATVGLAAEWAWTHVFFPLPWGTALLPEAPLLALVAGAAGGVLGGLTGRALAPESLPRQATPRGWAAAAWVGAFVCLALPLPMTADEAIPAPAVELASGATATFLPDKQVLQREARTDNIWLERGAYVLLAAIALSWVAALAWGLRRLDRGATLSLAPDQRYPPDTSPFVSS
jgi:hypothetical protein